MYKERKLRRFCVKIASKQKVGYDIIRLAAQIYEYIKTGKKS